MSPSCGAGTARAQRVSASDGNADLAQRAIWEGGRAGGGARQGKVQIQKGGCQLWTARETRFKVDVPVLKPWGPRRRLMGRSDSQGEGFTASDSFWGLRTLDASFRRDSSPGQQAPLQHHPRRGAGERQAPERPAAASGPAEPRGAQAILGALFSSIPTAASLLDLQRTCALVSALALRRRITSV